MSKVYDSHEKTVRLSNEHDDDDYDDETRRKIQGFRNSWWCLA